MSRFPAKVACARWVFAAIILGVTLVANQEFSHASAAQQQMVSGFEFRNASWPEVFEWLSGQAGVPIIATSQPDGKFTFVPPQHGKKYPISEVMEILNKELIPKDYELVRKERNFFLYAIEEFTDKLWRVQLKELPGLPRKASVSIVISLHSIKAEGISEKLKNMLGPRGQLDILKKTNKVIIQDRVEVIRHIWATIQEMEKNKK